MKDFHEPVDTAILFAGWHEAGDGAEDMATPAALLPLLDRPMLQRVVERLVREGSRHLHVILGEHPTGIRNLLESGERWGCTVTYHYHLIDETVAALMARLALNAEQSYRLADGNILPALEEAAGQPSETACGTAQCWQTEQGREWSGWGVFSGDWLLSLTVACVREAVGSTVLQDERIEKTYASAPLIVVGPADLILAGKRLMLMEREYEQSGLKPGAGAKGEGVWVGRDCSIHPLSRLIPPLYLSRGVKIGERAVVGPNVVIGQGAFIDRGARLTDCAVLPYTYVGEEMELNRVVVSGHHLHNAALETTIEVTDRGMLSYLPRHGGHAENGKSLDKLPAMALRILLAPAYWILRLFVEKPAAKSFVMAAMPVTGTDGLREITIQTAPPSSPGDIPGALAGHFVHTFYPGLGEVWRGRLKLQGPEIRSREQVLHLHEDWRELYWESKCGLLQEALLMGSEGMKPDVRYAADALAAHCRDSRATRKLVRRYLAGVFADFFGAAGGRHEAQPGIPRTVPHRDGPLNRIN